LLHAPDADVIAIEADGNCLYAAISKALPVNDDLRSVVAKAISIKELEFYQMLTHAGVPGYEVCAACSSIEELRALIRQPKLVWADQFAMETLQTALKIRLWVIDDGAKRDKYVCVGGSKTSVAEDQTIVLLHRTRRQHYNLVTIKGKAALKLSDMSSETLLLFITRDQIHQKKEGKIGTCIQEDDGDEKTQTTNNKDAKIELRPSKRRRM
jgi:hypothetical protein